MGNTRAGVGLATETRRRRDAGETLTDIARTYGVSHMTIARVVEAPP
jgi:hypothetical protein